MDADEGGSRVRSAESDTGWKRAPLADPVRHNGGEVTVAGNALSSRGSTPSRARRGPVSAFCGPATNDNCKHDKLLD